MKKISYAVLLIFLAASIFPAAHAQDQSYAETTATFLNQDPDPAEPGDYVELRWKIEKEGNGELKDIVYMLDVSYPFSFDSSDNPEKELGDWKGFSDDDDYYLLYYKVRVDEDALEDTYAIDLKKRYANTGWVSEEFDIRIGENLDPNFVLGSVESSPTKLVADIDEAEIDVTLENIGDGDADNVKAVLLLPEGFSQSYSYSTISALGTIEAGTGDVASFFIDIDEGIMGGEYPTTIRLTYKESDDDDNIYKTVDIPFTIQMTDKPSFEIIETRTTPENVKPGDEVAINVIVKNVGGEEGESVSLRAYKESSQPFDFDEKSDFIGNLKPGEEGEAVLKLTVDEDSALKSYLIDLEIRSITGEEVILEDEKMTLVVDGKEGNDNDSPQWILPLILAVVFAAIGFILGRYLKK